MSYEQLYDQFFAMEAASLPPWSYEMHNDHPLAMEAAPLHLQTVSAYVQEPYLTDAYIQSPYHQETYLQGNYTLREDTLSTQGPALFEGRRRAAHNQAPELLDPRLSCFYSVPQGIWDFLGTGQGLNASTLDCPSWGLGITTAPPLPTPQNLGSPFQSQYAPLDMPMVVSTLAHVQALEDGSRERHQDTSASVSWTSPFVMKSFEVERVGRSVGNRKRSPPLTNQRRGEICQYKEANPLTPNADIALIFDVTAPTVSKILRKPEKWHRLAEGESRSKMANRGSKYPQLEIAMVLLLDKWSSEQREITYTLIKSEALDLSGRLKIGGFGASNNWLASFVKRHRIRGNIWERKQEFLAAKASLQMRLVDMV